ncbi:ribosome hibernation-promoting factor, HPF/YfiA family [Neobacillus cucumis]|uniref:ribosome hibernation-promoting factor, HPF/YfiA family n=1 Tax=Neobacillus cucumis TaxID=1740721 RepID=UPI0019651914|nr:ribosome-associated translation inhibitor RaiA [Neobacillus cucumis]MBM7655415.1 ribosomal subunit interface protein [Neobacillus cucumis]
MNFNIRGENIEVTSAILEYVEKKVSKLDRHLIKKHDTSAHVNLRINPDKTSKIEVTIVQPQLVLRAEETNLDLYAAIDLILDKLERQIRKNKTKVNRKFRDRVGYCATFTTDMEENEKEDQLEIVRVKQFDLKPMDSEEAILQMDLIGHSFYVFTDAYSNQTNVVYKRKDGRYGLIEAK